MVGTIIIHGSNGEVLAPIGGGEFIPGKRQDILIIAVCKDEDLPIEVREAFVGMRISTIFNSEQVKGAAPPGSRIAYSIEVVEALRKTGKDKEAEMLLQVTKDKDPESEYSFLVFNDGDCEVLAK
ncbi:MAG: hypothetical protein G01um101456_132 [Parcubacteria group bacterium Gr01-1014_56]|nr:MAG: hypothetical protein G01um101456_132 [Parcubacteria group bacterium Gr01-1014_56]